MSIFNRVIDNPLNPASGDGRVKNRTRGTKGVLLLFVVLAIMFLSLPYVYIYVNTVLNSWAVTSALIAIVYLPIALKFISITVLDEKQNKIAFIDQLENETSTLSTIWEVQDIRETDIEESKVGYMDHINGMRTMIVKIVNSSIINIDESVIEVHLKTLEKFYNSIDDVGFMKDLDFKEESLGDDEALRYYYQAANNGDQDEEYLKVFTRILDYNQYIIKTFGSVTTINVIIHGWGPNKHLMTSSIPSFLSILEGSPLIYEYYLLDYSEINTYIEEDNSVSSFDINDIKMRKYKNKGDLGETAVLETRDESGNTIEVYNPKFDVRTRTTIKSFSTSKESDSETLTAHEKLKLMEKNKNTVSNKIEDKVKYVEADSIQEIASEEDSLFIRLANEDTFEEVELGGKE